MQKRFVSLLLAAALLCALIGCARADEKDVYRAFADAYGPDYEDPDWEKFLTDAGGVENIDLDKLAAAVGYEDADKLDVYPLVRLVNNAGGDGWALYDEFTDAKARLFREYWKQRGASELVLTYCNKQIMDTYPLDFMEEFLDLFINRLEPQAVNLIRNRVPAFRDAPEQAFSDSTGLELITRSYLVSGAMNANMSNSMESMIGVNLLYFIAQNEEGEYGLASKKRHIELNNDIIHEMVHMFMFDYNRNGKTSNGIVDKDRNYSIPGYGVIDSGTYWDMYDYYKYPEWFIEGTACLAAGRFAVEDNYYKKYGLLTEDVFSSHITPEALAEAFSKNAGRLNNYGMMGDNAKYSFASIAIAWLSDAQRQADGHGPAIVRGTDGEIISVDEAALLDGFSRILERLHLGEPLDDVIRRVSHAKYLDTEDFGSHFICGDENGTDWETASFAAAWLNYLVRLSNEKGYIVSGSLVCGLASNDLESLDWDRREQAAFYQIIGNDYVPSSVPVEIYGHTAGTSAYSIFTNLEFASYYCSQGADGVYVKGSGTPLSFVFERTENDEKAFSCFTALEVNGGILTPGSQYHAASGSVKAELLPAYLDTLAPGAYKLTAVFDDEKAVTVNFTVQAQPGSFEAVAVPSDTFTFKKVWEGDAENSIDFTLYKADGSVYHHGFDKKIVSRTQWQYNAWFSEPAACYVIEGPVEGYITRYENVGVYAGITDRCCDGGTIINKRIPRTGDSAPLLLWAGMILLGAAGIGTALIMGKRRKAGR